MSSLSDASSPQVRLLSASEFAAAIGKTERQVYRYIQKGRLQALSPEETGLPGVRIPEAELERFLGRFGPPTSPWARSAVGTVGAPGEVRPRVGPPGGSVEGYDSFEDSSEDYPSAEAEAPVAAPNPLVVPLERHEAAVMRLGYLESQLEQSRRMLTDGTQQESDLRRRLEELEAALKEQERESLRASVRAETEADGRAEAESRARQLAVRLEEAERRAQAPWWKRLLGGA